MPVMINEVVTEFQPERQGSAGIDNRPDEEAGAPAGEPVLQQLAEMQALLRARQQRLEVD